MGLSALLGVGVAAFCLITRTAQLRLFFGTITDEVMQAIEECNPLAPLHNPANIIGIKACQELMPGVPMAVVFDTAFHQTMPEKAYLYGLPYEYYQKYKIRRYGFHGTSHDFVFQTCRRTAWKRQKGSENYRMPSWQRCFRIRS